MTSPFRVRIDVMMPFIIPCIIVCLLSSCNASKQIDKSIASHYALTPPSQPVEAPSYLRTNYVFGDTSFFKGPSVTQRNTNILLPLLIYIQAKQGYTTRLNPQYPANQFINYIHQYSSSKAIANYLGSRTIVLKIEQMPLQFSYEIKKEVFLLFQLYGSQYAFDSHNGNIIVSYTVSGANQPEKSGAIELEDPTQKIMLGPAINRGYYSFAREFLEKYDIMLKKSAKSLVDEVLRKI